MQSLIDDQLSSPKFQKMWQYSWYKSGYTNIHPGNFQNVVDVFSHLKLTNARKIVKN